MTAEIERDAVVPPPQDFDLGVEHPAAPEKTVREHDGFDTGTVLFVVNPDPVHDAFGHPDLLIRAVPRGRLLA
jgi:hypothetical protein